MSKLSKAQIKRNRKAWIEALRSGKYKQTKGKLKGRNGSYCCLGVACEVAGLPKVYEGSEYTYGDEEILPRRHDYLSYVVDYERFSSTGLPKAAQEWLGVASDSPNLAKPVVIVDECGNEHEEDNLVELNDTYGWNFTQIADAVEKYGLKDD